LSIDDAVRAHREPALVHPRQSARSPTGEDGDRVRLGRVLWNPHVLWR
jgi:hypothetical protein